MSFRLLATDLLLVLFVIWFAVSALCQPTSSLSAWIRRHDVLNLIPSWTFFAPNPGMHDLYLLYRDRLSDGTLTVWREVRLSSSSSLSLLWNPQRRHNKALLDVMKHFALEIRVHAGSTNSLQISLPYLAVLHHISRIHRDRATKGTQFLLMRSDAVSQALPNAVFLSAIHPLDDDQ